MAEGIKCPHCGLVQYRADDNLCKRCKVDLDTVPEPPPEEEIMEAEVEEAPPPKKGVNPAAIPLMVLGGMAILFLLFVMVKVPTWTGQKNARVGYFKDTTKLIEIDFPSGWRFLGLRKDVEKGALNLPGSGGKTGADTIRGSFFRGHKKDPDAIFYITLDSLGLMGSMGFSLTGQALDRARPEEIVAAMHQATALHAAALGGTYRAMGMAREPVGPYKMLKAEGVMNPTQPLLRWDGGREIRVIVLFHKDSARLYWLRIYLPEERFAETWPSVQQVLQATTIHRPQF